MLLTWRGQTRRELNEGRTFAYTKGNDSMTLWPVHCVLLLLWWNTGTFVSPPGQTNMQDGNWTQIFHQGPFTSLPDHRLGSHQGFVGVLYSRILRHSPVSSSCSLNNPSRLIMSKDDLGWEHGFSVAMIAPFLVYSPLEPTFNSLVCINSTIKWMESVVASCRASSVVKISFYINLNQRAGLTTELTVSVIVVLVLYLL